jgi:Eco57I restriction-modification methylase/TaqI-like C-terminal specificity domain
MNLVSKQLNFDLYGDLSSVYSPSLTAAIEKLSSAAGTESRGSIFTRVEVVEFILDLAGYTEDKPLHKSRLLEPSFGGGDFLFPVVSRLITAWRLARDSGSALGDLGNAIQAVELHRNTFDSTRTALISLLNQEGLTVRTATDLADLWLTQGDFLLTPLEGNFDFIVGNPPYVRQELIPAPLLAEYRIRYQTMYDRADIYIPFIERSLLLLSNRGILGFICADRWMKNRYGGPLRSLVADQFHLKIYVDMMDTPAFHSNVVAYPAITIISRDVPGATRIAHRPAIDRSSLKTLADALSMMPLPKESRGVRELAQVTNGSEPWLLESSDQMALIRRIEQQFPSLEEVGCKVGIGVATGADKAFIGNFDLLDVEPDRKLPLVTTRDIMSGEVQWQGLGVINPFAEGGGLVDLHAYPCLRRYLEARQEVIAGRHCAQKSPINWYRTIDRITPLLTKQPKLLIPDIKGDANIVFEKGALYPHHNLYYVTSEGWNLRALQAVMLSAVTRLFIATYSTKMRGGFLRFQAQYLRRIRIPAWADVPTALRAELAEAAIKRDLQACNYAVFDLYELSHEERSALGGNGETNVS